jgi:16S rRNA (cytosine1402-N4)-methyltransferase
VIASGKTPAGTHRPILVSEILEVLRPAAGEIGVDCTLGYGGHATELWRRVQPGGRLIAFDVDPVELPRTEARLRDSLNPGDSLLVVPRNFAGLPQALAAHGIEGVDFILADLGVSSMQLDDPSRGFSYKTDSPLDLRMNPSRGVSAAARLKSIREEALRDLLREHSDEPRAALIARAVIEARQQAPIDTTRRLGEIVRKALASLPGRVGEEANRTTLQRVFQALRIDVNGEFTALETLLRHAPACLKPGGRIAFLTFHSGEDRRIKKSFQEGWRAGLYARVAEDVVRAGPEERASNPRASSAKLRWAVRSERTSPTTPDPSAHPAPEDHPLLEFRKSGIHGTGAFARQAIPSGTQVIEYLGERISKEESLRRCMRNNEYVFRLDETSDLDGDVSWNPARLLNHSCDPNCEAVHERGHIWIVSTRAIAAGEEVTFNYGFDLDRYRDYPCACGSPRCVGYMVAEEFHDHLRGLKAGDAGPTRR